jgi:hypothetical protein
MCWASVHSPSFKAAVFCLRQGCLGRQDLKEVSSQFSTCGKDDRCFILSPFFSLTFLRVEQRPAIKIQYGN